MSKRETLFAQLEERAADARVTMLELRVAAGVSRPTFWRASTGRQSKDDSFIPTLRKLEAALDAIERERTPL